MLAIRPPAAKGYLYKLCLYCGTRNELGNPHCAGCQYKPAPYVAPATPALPKTLEIRFLIGRSMYEDILICSADGKATHKMTVDTVWFRQLDSGALAARTIITQYLLALELPEEYREEYFDLRHWAQYDSPFGERRLVYTRG